MRMCVVLCVCVCVCVCVLICVCVCTCVWPFPRWSVFFLPRTHTPSLTSPSRAFYLAVYCDMLQYIAVCCSVLQYVTHFALPALLKGMCCSVLRCVAVCCSVLQCVVVCCSVLQCVKSLLRSPRPIIPRTLAPSLPPHGRRTSYASCPWIRVLCVYVRATVCVCVLGGSGQWTRCRARTSRSVTIGRGQGGDRNSECTRVWLTLSEWRRRTNFEREKERERKRVRKVAGHRPVILLLQFRIHNERVLLPLVTQLLFLHTLDANKRQPLRVCSCYALAHEE